MATYKGKRNVHTKIRNRKIEIFNKRYGLFLGGDGWEERSRVYKSAEYINTVGNDGGKKNEKPTVN